MRTSSAAAHFDAAGPELEPLQRFYSAVFGWQVEPKGPGYALVRTSEGSADGALVEAEEPSLVLGVVVGDLEAALAAAQQADGQVVMPATDNGWVVKAQIADPAGNRVTLIQA